jgi:hypothetical protein
VPPPGCLPPPLLAFLASSGPGPSPSQQQNQHANTQHPAPTEKAKPVSVSDAFGDVNVDDTPPPPLGSALPGNTSTPPVQQQSSPPKHTSNQASHHQSKPSPQHVSQPQSTPSHSHEQDEVSNGVMAVSDSAKRMKKVNDGALETMDKTQSGLKYLIQNLNAEKVSLNAAGNIVFLLFLYIFLLIYSCFASQ